MTTVAKNLKNLKDSSLLRSLALGFVLVALVETTFLAILCFDFGQANEQATHQYRVLQASHHFTRLADLMRRHRRTVDDNRWKTLTPEITRIHGESARRITKQMSDTEVAWENAGLDMSSIRRCADKVRGYCGASTTMFRPGQSREGSKAAYEVFIQRTKETYEQAVFEMKLLHKVVDDDASEKIAFGPDKVLMCGLAVNAILFFLLSILVDRKLTRPIRNLADSCRGLAQAQVIPAPRSAKSEVGKLEQAFHEMSLKVAHNEKGRRSYVHSLKDVQSAALKSVRERINVIAASGKLHPKARENFNRMRVGLSGMLELLDQMTEAMSFNADDNLKIQVTVSKLNLKSLCDELKSSLSFLLESRQIGLDLDVVDVEIAADGNLLSRALLNLLSNAVKYSACGDTVRFSAVADGNRVLFEVTDTGPGISEEGIKKLFQRFSQLDPADKIKRQGTGLGLMIARQIAEAHGGDIGCRSEIGKGSCFWISVPLVAEVKPDSGKEEPARQPAKQRSSIKHVIVGMFIVFVLGQGFFAGQIFSQFTQATRTAETYAAEKRMTINTQNLLAQFLDWRQKLADAIKDGSIKGFIKSWPLINAQRKTLKTLVAESRQGSDVQKLVKEIAVIFDEIHKVGTGALKLVRQMKMDEVGKMLPWADEQCMKVENKLFETLNLEVKNLEVAFDSEVALKNAVLTSVVLAGMFNGLMLIVVAVIGYRLVEKIRILYEKARQFAEGKEINPSLSGNDELRVLDESLCEAAAKIRMAEEQRTNLMAAINHDLRTPLTSLLNGLEMVSEGVFGEMGDEEHDLVLSVEADLKKVLEQVNDLLAIEKIDAGSFSMERQLVDAAKTLLQIVQKMRLKWRDAGVSINFGVEPSDAQIPVLVDSPALERAVQALVDNAVQASQEDQEVKVTLTVEDKGVCVSVSDTGAGIPEELVPNVFERFRFVDGKPISGLGLPLAFRLSSLMGADLLLVKSDAGGSLLRLSIPQVEGAA